MIDEKVLIERLEEEFPMLESEWRKEIYKIVNQLAEESNKKYEPTMDLIEYGIKGYNHHLKEQYRSGYYDAKRELLGPSDSERVDNLSKQIAVYLTKYGVNITEKLDTAVRNTYALDQAYLRGRQDELNKFIKWREAQGEGWTFCDEMLPEAQWSELPFKNLYVAKDSNGAYYRAYVNEDVKWINCRNGEVLRDIVAWKEWTYECSKYFKQ